SPGSFHPFIVNIAVDAHIIRHILNVCFFTKSASTEIYSLSLHDALPISKVSADGAIDGHRCVAGSDRESIVQPRWSPDSRSLPADRKSTRLNSSHRTISYAVFCLKKKNVRAMLVR